MVRQPSQCDGGTQPQVFVSYARQDAEKVLEIARLLEKEGAIVWRDGDHILGGQYYGEEIVHAIAHSRVVMLMCSPDAFKSDNVHREVLLTWDYYHRRYIPVWLGPESGIPERFRYCLVGCQWIDAHSQPPQRWLPQLLKAFKALGVETAKDTPPQPADSPPTPDVAAVETGRRGLRFRPGDKPIRGADWELERLLGKGGFGEVWKAHNPDLPGLPPVALKFCLDLDSRSKEVLRHEANMVLRAQQQIRSDGIVPLLHAYLNNDPPCLEYPYIGGGTLVRLLDECRQSAGSFTPAQVQQIIQRIAQIVSPAHRATPKLIHRDLKPSNILVERRSEGKLVLRVTDFGIGGIVSQAVLEHSRSSSSLEGYLSSVLTGAYSPLYASPQQVRGDKPDTRDDVYALGVIWYQLLMGDLAIPAPTGPRSLEALRRRGMSEAAIDVLTSCFESEPTYRPVDAGMLAEQLLALPTSNSAKAVDTTEELTGVELGSLPSLDSSSPDRPVLTVTPEELARDAPVLPTTAPDPRAGTTPVPAEPQARHKPTISRDPSPSPSHAKPAPLAEPDFQADTWRHASQSQPRGGRTGRSWRWIAAEALVLFLILGVVLYITTDNGTVKITGTDPAMKVLIDGTEVRNENLGKPITFRTGVHKLLVTRDGLDVQTNAFLIRRGEETVLQVTYTPIASVVAPTSSVDTRSPVEVNTRKPVERVEPSKTVRPNSPSPPPEPEFLTTRVGQIKLKLVPAGTFLMGSPDGEGDSDEHPQHEVRITRPFYLGVYEVTQAQYQAVSQNPSYFASSGEGKYTVAGPSTDQHPVETVSWLDTVKFCNALSQKEGLKPFYELSGETVSVPDSHGTAYRLPSEAEWEYACRARTTTKYSFGDDPKELGEYAWYDGNSKINGNSSTHPVGQKQPNAFGLFDMHGNVLEWCWDGYGDDFYKTSTRDDPNGIDASIDRVFRGGNYDVAPGVLRAADRGRCQAGDRYRFIGFRLARTCY